MADELTAERGAQQYGAAAREADHGGAAAALGDGQRRTRPLHLAGRAGQQGAHGFPVQPEDRADLLVGELVAHGEFERLALLGRGAGRLRPGQPGELPAAALRLRLGDRHGVGG
ncbi:hypothetical protein [Streptomyces sp. URMC 123]|uniref:hypothetical protein n=1 Tax=Streptomyces sp. URMC 123 TaxID=3423403 RepID=UPI003F1C9878